jgi:predicted nuclease of predicted toxin-antitoxin system
VKLLLDNCVPRPFRRHLADHEVSTAHERGWASLSNGELLWAAADGGFAALVTVDQNLQYQQNLAKLPLSVLLVRSPSLDPDILAQCAPHLPPALERIATAIKENRRILVVVSADRLE